MYNLLIVDDEVFIADGLYRLFQRQTDLSLEVYRVYSAREALNLLDKYRIDIVITDIQMPGMNGLEMIEKIKYHCPNCHIIILTGYSEFDYARTAIQLGANYYLLKSQGDNPLIEAVKQCIDKMDNYESEAEWKCKTKSALSKAKPLLQQELLQGLLNDTLCLPANLQEALNDLDIPLNSVMPVQLVAARIDKIPEHSSNKTLSHYTTAIDIIFRECTNAKAQSVQIILQKQRYMLWMIQSQPDYGMDIIFNYIRGMLDKIQNHCSNVLQISVSFIIEPQPVSWKNLPAYYHKLYYILTHQLSKKEENLLGDTIFFENKNVESSQTQALYESFILLNQLFERQDKSAFTNLYLSLLDKMFDFSSPELQITIYHNICTLLINAIMSSSKYMLYMKEFHDLSLFSIPYENWDIELYESFIKVADWIFETEENESESRYNHMIYIIHEYIEHHLSEDISLSVLAEQVYLNPVYLSRAYKQKTGQNISKYIADCRIQKAKDMLKSPNLKINEIAYGIGYESPAHFSRIFKKATGYSPIEYREKYFRL